jgi:hypothetical protein
MKITMSKNKLYCLIRKYYSDLKKIESTNRKNFKSVQNVMLENVENILQANFFPPLMARHGNGDS